jgi:excinuclease ABC subunit C
MIDDLGKFLEGRTGPILERLRNDMQLASEQLRFERAAALRDQILAIEKVVERQKVVSPEYVDSDVLAMARSEKEACMQVFFIRGGKLIGREYFMLEGTQDTPDTEVMAEFIKQFYDQASSIPPQVLLPNEVEEANIIQQWLSGRRAKENQDMRPVEILIPREGQQQELVQMATENAIETLAALKAQWETDRHRQTAALAELESALKLTSPPNRIECYDISNTQGTYAVGSMVVFEQGVPDKKQYRRFNIRSVVGADDFASMEEVLMRRFKRWEVANHIQSSEATPGTEQTEQQPSDTKQKPSGKVDASFSHLPDLLIVDGGKGQLSRAMAVIERFNLTEKVPAIGLAKKEEEVYVPGHSNPIFLSRNSQGLYLLQRIRDEAHRFAITAHRKQRTKQGLTSTLESIPGVGPNRRKALLTYFGSLENICQASIEQLTSVPSITHKLAQVIKAYLG